MYNFIPGEKDYVIAFSEGRFDDAKRHLIEAICAIKKIDAPPVLAGFTQRFGSLLLKQGEALGAIAMYELSETLDAGSLLVKLDYAKFLLREMGDKAAAILKAEELIEAATACPFPGNDYDFSSDEYIEAGKRLIEEAR